MSSELVRLGATDLARRIRAKEVSPVEVVQALRERDGRVGASVNALVTPFPDAEERAREAEQAVLRGDELGPLHGVPCTFKDCFDTAGVRTTRGSALFANRVPTTDATVVSRLRKAGAIPLAKSNTPEFALWWETDNLVFGRTLNPWDVERTAGGSSGGEAAAVAAGLSPLGVGSDLGGSIRMPAHYCGVVGLKPTHGRVPLTGHWPEVLLGFMHAGPLARSVEDASLALSVLEGPDGRDWLAAPAPPLGEPGQPPRPVRIGVLGDRAFGRADPEVLACVRAAAEALGGGGYTVVDASIPGLERHDWNVLTMTLYGAGGRTYFREVIGDRWDELHPRLRDRLTAPLASLDDYLAAEAAVEELRRDVARFFEAHELLLCSTSLVPAHGHDADELTIGGVACAPRTTMRATIPFDLTGSPALSVPFGRREGLPIGVQLVGRRFEDATVLEAGLALEDARGPLALPTL